MSKKREYDEEYKVQAIELAKNLSGNPMESRKLTGKHTNLMIFWNVISQQMHRCKSVWQILQKFRQKTENCMFQQFLTAMTYCQWVCQWRIICVRYCAVKCWNMRICGFRKSAEPLCIPTVAASTPVLHIGQSFKNTALCKAWTVREEDAMIMRDVKAFGQGWKKNCFIIGEERQNITKWKSWNSWSGGISWVAGATAESVRPLASFLLL